MVKLKNIERKNDILSCLVFFEDCKEPVLISLNEKTGVLSEFVMPKGYEWCEYHIRYAEKYLNELVGKPIDRTSHSTMWC